MAVPTCIAPTCTSGVDCHTPAELHKAPRPPHSTSPFSQQSPLGLSNKSNNLHYGGRGQRTPPFLTVRSPLRLATVYVLTDLTPGQRSSVEYNSLKSAFPPPPNPPTPSNQSMRVSPAHIPMDTTQLESKSRTVGTVPSCTSSKPPVTMESLVSLRSPCAPA